MNTPNSIIILAAGQGTRMRSSLPKVLHCLAGKPLLAHVVDTVTKLKPENIYVVYGTDRPEVKESLSALNVTWVAQAEQLGTAHAVQQVLPLLGDQERVLILCADGPLITVKTLEKLVAVSNDQLSWLTAKFEQPSGLGRIVRDKDGKPCAIVEEKDATKEQQEIKEINTGICAVPAKFLKENLKKIKSENAQQEYYLTDLFSLAVEQQFPLNTVLPTNIYEVKGVNNRMQLAELERVYQMQQAEELMKQGVTLMDPRRFDLRGQLKVGQDVIIDVNVIVEGDVRIGSNTKIGSNVYLRDVIIGDNVEIRANSILEEAEVADDCQVGPFARLRPGAKLSIAARVGNFVEIKQSTIGKSSKVNHLSYIGDTLMGDNVNIGAGTITCNYDGANKHQTVIEDNAHIGSNNNLVAPVTIGKGATTGSGSTITKNAPAGKLTVARARQMSLNGWVRPEKL